MDKLISDKNVISYKIKDENNSTKFQINYDILKSALQIEGLSSSESPSKSEAQEKFIKMIKSAQISSHKPLKKNAMPEKIEKKDDYLNSKEDFNVKSYTKMYHPIKIEHDEDKSLHDRLRKISQLCKKMPMERSPKEVEKIYRILKTFPGLSLQIDDDMLKLLSTIVIHESYDVSDLPLFGNKGFYVILKGHVRTECSPYIRLIGETTEKFFAQEDNCHQNVILYPGECFGTLDEIIKEDIDCSKCLMATVSGSCEVLLITTSYYRRILEKYETQKHSDKLSLLKSREAFNVWPYQALVRVANILSWVIIPANTLICKEDSVSSVLGFIQSGSCYVLRKLDVNRTLPSGKVRCETKQVLIGTLEMGHSFGEISLLDQTPMKYSLLSKNEIKVIQTSAEKIAELDSDVRLLLRQTCISDFENVSKASVEDIYMEQKVKKDWVNLKECVISEVIESRGIRPGHGKWNVMTDPNNIY